MERRLQKQRERHECRQQKLHPTSDQPAPAEEQWRHRHDVTAEQPVHIRVTAKDSLHPASPPPTTTAKQLTSAAERPKSLDLHRTSSQPRPSTGAGELRVLPAAPGAADAGATQKRPTPVESDQHELPTAVHGRCKLKVSDIPGSDSRAERVDRWKFEPPVVATKPSQTPDSGLGVSPLDQRGAATAVRQPTPVTPDVVPSPSGLEYRIAQTPTMSTIVIIRNDSSLPHAAGSQPSRTTTPSTPSPVRDNQMPFSLPVSSGVVQPGAWTASTSSRQPVNVSSATSKFVVSDSMATAAVQLAAGGPVYRSYPSTPSDDRTMLRLNSSGSEQRRYVITSGALTTVQEITTAKSFPATSQSIEHKPAEALTTSPAHAQLDVGSRQIVVPPTAVRDVQKPAPTDRVVTSSKSKTSTSVAKQRDAKSAGVGKQRQSTGQKRASTNGNNGQSGQRSKQSQIIAKQTENRSRVPAKSNNKRHDNSLVQPVTENSLAAKRSVAELRAVFQTGS